MLTHPSLSHQNAEPSGSSNGTRFPTRAVDADLCELGPEDRPGLVSVIIPFYDTPPQFLEEAIESVRIQTYAAWELVLASDGARGECVELAERHAARDPRRTRVVTHPGGAHRGHSATRNLGFAHARGEFVTFLDSDDVFLAHKLEEQVALLRLYPTADMVYGLTEYWHSWTRDARDRGRDHVPPLGVVAPTLADPPLLLPMYLAGTAAVPCTCSVLARREAVQAVGGFDETFRALYGDQAFYAKMCLSARILVSDGLWDRYRQHRESLTGRTRPAREREHRLYFLNWLEEHLRHQGNHDRLVWHSVRSEKWKLRHPHLARVLRTGRRLARRVRHSSPLAAPHAGAAGR